MALLGTAPRACGAGDALCGQGAACCVLPGCFGGLRTELLMDSFPCLQGKNQPWAVLEPGAHHPVPLQQNLHLCFAGMCPRGPGLAAPVPAHHTQPSVDPMGGLELRVGCSAPEHNNNRTRHFPLLLHKPSSSGVGQSRRFPCRDYSGSRQPDAKALPAFFAGAVPQHQSEEEEEEGNARVQKSV